MLVIYYSFLNLFERPSTCFGNNKGSPVWIPVWTHIFNSYAKHQETQLMTPTVQRWFSFIEEMLSHLPKWLWYPEFLQHWATVSSVKFGVVNIWSLSHFKCVLIILVFISQWHMIWDIFLMLIHCLCAFHEVPFPTLLILKSIWTEIERNTGSYIYDRIKG